ncbi:MAG: hypothetical protein AAFR61_02125 [Bacteroidota bacterium]
MKQQSFPFAHLRSFHWWGPLLLCALFALLSLICYFRTAQTCWKWLTCLLGLGCFSWIVHGLCRRVIIDQEGVRYYGFFKKWSISWSEVVRYGGFLKGNFTFFPLRTKDLYQQRIRGRKYLYLSRTSHLPLTRRTFLHADALYFPYRREALDLIRYHMDRQRKSRS